MKKRMLLLFLCILAAALMGGTALGEETPAAGEYAYVRTDSLLNRLNVRFDPSEEHKAYYKLCYGVRVRVERRENGWAYISCGTEDDIARICGYVQEKYLDFESDGTAYAQIEPIRIRVANDAFYIWDTYWYYPWPRHDDDRIPAGTEMTVLAVKGNFDLTDDTNSFDAFYVETDQGERFWLRNWPDFAIEAVNPQGYTAKTTQSVRLRKGADIGSKALKLIDAGKKVEILLRGEGWTMVKYRGETGYVLSRYLLFPAVSP